MIDDQIRSELSELFHNTSLVRVERLATENGLKPLVDAYVRETFGVAEMRDLDAAQLKELLDFVSRFTEMVRARGEGRG
jgi:hypothetical protein